MNESESADEVTKSHKLSGKSTFMLRRCERAQQIPVYGLRAYRYAGDMTLMQALKENLGDPIGVTGQ